MPARYRPIPIALGTIRPLLSYPRLVRAHALRGRPSPFSAWPTGGTCGARLRRLTAAGYQELRSPGDPTPVVTLTATADPNVPGRSVLSRPRTSLEAARDVLSMVSPDFATGTPDYIVQRDSRGYAAVPLTSGAVPAPFVDSDWARRRPGRVAGRGRAGTVRHLERCASHVPFLRARRTGWAARHSGRALGSAGASLEYGYVDAYQTALAALARNSQAFFASGVAANKETAMNALAALPVLAGTRDPQPTSTKVYPPDPYAVRNWSVGHTGSPPPGSAPRPSRFRTAPFTPRPHRWSIWSTRLDRWPRPRNG